jgi:hypothetical protein
MKIFFFKFHIFVVQLTGVLIRIDSMPEYLRWPSYVNYFRYGFNSLVVDVYGFGRCDKSPDLSHNKTNWIEAIPMPTLIEIYTSDKVNVEALLSALKVFTGEDFNQTESIGLTFFDLEDYNLYEGIVGLIVLMIAFRVLTYFFILKKVKSRT